MHTENTKEGSYKETREWSNNKRGGSKEHGVSGSCVRIKRKTRQRLGGGCKKINNFYDDTGRCTNNH